MKKAKKIPPWAGAARASKQLCVMNEFFRKPAHAVPNWTSNWQVSHQGGAGESGFCYEAGASVEVAPVDALLTSPLATAAPAKPEALPAVPREDEVEHASVMRNATWRSAR